MKILDWPPHFVARCPVTLLEAASGSNSWHPSRTVGELHMRPLGNSTINFQLHDLLDNQLLFEYTMHKPDLFIASAERFFVIRLENGSFRGFGFTEKAAANEMKERVQKAVKPFIISDHYSTGKPCSTKEPLASQVSLESPAVGSKSLDIVSYESIPRRSLPRKSFLHTEQPTFRGPTSFASTLKLRRIRLKWKTVLKGITALTQIFGFRDHEIEIGYPTDVKHVAHIGWDGPSITGPSWMDELRPAPDFSVAPLRDFGQPRGPDWTYDALSAAKWTSQGLSENSGLPPAPPQEFQERGKDPMNMGQRSSRFKNMPSTKEPKFSVRMDRKCTVYE